jgi:hypothetical protein
MTLLLVLVFILTANEFLPGGSGTTIRYHAQTKHSTQNYTNNKGHTTHNEYNENTLNYNKYNYNYNYIN